MKFTGRNARARAALLLLLAACAVAPAEAATPSLLWADARQVAIRCLVQSNSLRGAEAFESALCGRIVALAGRGAPYPVKQVEAGDPALIAGGTVTLLVHASVERTALGRSAAFTIRPYRAAEGGDVPFGTRPLAVDLGSASFPQALETALAEALAEILPWQRPSGLGARPL